MRLMFEGFCLSLIRFKSIFGLILIVSNASSVGKVVLFFCSLLLSEY